MTFLQSLFGRNPAAPTWEPGKPFPNGCVPLHNFAEEPERIPLYNFSPTPRQVPLYNFYAGRG